MIFSVANLKKAVNYLKKNGPESTYYAVLERISQAREEKYVYIPPTEEELERQKAEQWKKEPFFSVIVPAYETKRVFMEDLILSLADQTYKNYELIIADASESDVVERTVKDFQEQYERIVYVRLKENGGISCNSNEALAYAKGEYVGLLDHDDLLTPDALYHVAKEILEASQNVGSPVLIYTDEDKTNTYLEKYYEPHFKQKLNKDLILTNNYICHLSFIRKDVISRLRFRKEYDGAQDFDLILRTLLWTEKTYGEDWERRIRHVPKVLYHWRCHDESTAQNPASKMYAYEAGRRAVEDYMKEKQFEVTVTHMEHLGFYRTEYGEKIFEIRKDLGAVAGPVFSGGKIIGGAMDGKGKILYEGLRKQFSGYMHGAKLQQSVAAGDARNMKVREDLIPLFEKTLGVSYPMQRKDWEKLSEEEVEKIRKKSLQFCNKLKAKGIGVLYDPMQTEETV
ncbi:MAG: glycosyltransferase [Lachnospiraceae bacterium]|nr:glycosyltransferase [Lachnospiraceae bacterium]